MLDNTTKRRIDNARDILVGKVPDPKAQVDQITTALIYKFMFDMDQESVELGGEPAFFVGEYDQYAWSKLMDKRLGGHARLDLYVRAITSMSQNPHIPQLFRDIFKDAFLPYRDPETLNLFLKEIDVFTYDHSERLGDAFEYLLSILGSQGAAGQFRTPRHIIDFIVAAVAPTKTDTILDPACGTAGFLISAYKYILASNQDTPLTPDERQRLTENFVGYDIAPEMVRLSLVNMYLHKFPQPTIYEYDTLTSEERWDDTFDVILANPPFMTPKGGIRPNNRFSVQTSRSEVLFVDYIAEHLNPSGRAGVIVPEGIIFQSSNAYKTLRQMLVAENYLWAVVSMPAGVFNPYSGVKTSILLIDKTLARRVDRILFVDVKNDGYDLGAQRRDIDQDDLPKALNLLLQFQTDPTLKFNIPLALTVPKTHLAEDGDFILTSNRYRDIIDYSKIIFPLVRVADVFEKVSDNIDPLEHAGQVNYIGLENIESDTGRLASAIESDFSKIKSTKTQFEPGDILYGKLRPNLNKVLLADRSGICSTDIYVLRGDQSAIVPEFFAALMRSSVFNTEVLKGISGAQLPRVGWSYFGDLQIPLPPLNNQRTIVAEIESYQAIIDGARKVIDSYVPRLSVDPTWKLVILGDYVTDTQLGIVRNKSEQGTQAEGYKYPYVKMDCITDTGELVLDNIVYVNATDDEIARYTLSDGDFFYNTRNSPKLVGKSAVYHGESGKYLFNNNILVIRFSNEINPNYVNYVLHSDIGRNQIQSYIAGTTSVAAIYQKEFLSIRIPLAPIETQQALVAQIAREKALVAANRELVKIFQSKIDAAIARVWGEEPIS